MIDKKKPDKEILLIDDNITSGNSVVSKTYNLPGTGNSKFRIEYDIALTTSAAGKIVQLQINGSGVTIISTKTAGTSAPVNLNSTGGEIGYISANNYGSVWGKAEISEGYSGPSGFVHGNFKSGIRDGSSNATQDGTLLLTTTQIITSIALAVGGSAVFYGYIKIYKILT